MIWMFALKEIWHSIVSLKFILAFLLIILLMIASAFLFNQDYKDQLKSYGIRTSQAWQAKSVEQVYLLKEPTPMSLVAEGRGKYLPDHLKLIPGLIEDPGGITVRKSFIEGFSNIDWVFIIGVLLSLAAILFTFDAVSGEKEDGTLGLALSNPMARQRLVAGKYIGAMVSLLIPLIVGIPLNLLIATQFGKIVFTGSDWLRIGLILILSVLYLSGFVLLGITISSLTSKSSTSLIILLSMWVLLVVIIPNSGGLLSSLIHPIPTTQELQWKLDAVMNDFLVGGANSDRTKNYSALGVTSTWLEPIVKSNASPEEKKRQVEELERKIEAAQYKTEEKMWEAINLVKRDYTLKREQQTRLAVKLTCLSPSVIFQDASEALAGTGYHHHRRFVKSAQNYLRDFSKYSKALRWAKREEAKTPYATAGMGGLSLKAYRYDYSRVKFDYSDFPHFREPETSLSESIWEVRWNLFGLVFFNLIFILGSLVAFLRYDIR